MKKSDILKSNLCYFLRYKKGIKLIATECNYADILYLENNKIKEVEIKISYSDFLADFKKPKHNKNNKESKFTRIADYFYFGVPTELKDKCLKYLIENKLPYGLLVISDKTYNNLHLFNECKNRGKTIVETIKQAKPILDIEKRKIYNHRWNDYWKQEIINRMCNELCTLRVNSCYNEEEKLLKEKVLMEETKVTLNGKEMSKEQLEVEKQKLNEQKVKVVEVEKDVFKTKLEG